MGTTASTTATGFGRPGGGNPPESSSGPGAGAGAGTSYGFCRVTIVAPDSRIDVALPDDVPVADLHPEVLRLSRQGPAEGAPVGYHLVRRDGTVLDSARTFAAQRVLDGEILTLRPFSASLPPAVFDDVSEVVAAAVTRDHVLWTGDLTRAAGLVGGAVLSSLLAYVAWAAAPHHDLHGLPGVLAAVAGVLLLTLAGVRARVYDDRAAALAFGLGALPNVAAAGSGLLPVTDGQGVGRLQFLLACAAVLTASVILGLLSPSGDGPFVACVFASAVGLAATFLAALWRLEPVETAALCAPLAVGALAFLPGLSMRFARLPIGYEPPHGARGGYGADPAPQEPVDAERIAAQARRGQELLVGLVGGCALVAIGSAVVLALAADTWGQVLALATGIAMLTRAHLFRYTAQVAAVLAAGLVTLVLLGIGLCLDLPVGPAGDGAAPDLRTIWLVVGIAAATALVTGVGMIASRTGVTPFWGRFLEIAESFVLLTLVPLTLAVFGVYAEARAMTS
ncbi:type VII secretion integral membrane protein EccD [Streptomyces sp. NPDC050703]|uniref:type VII secretion integral membrane protein EccD n=1 Tax=Streptomyces sp. NPDC050703 TaxID=3157218 RepID=UPI003417A569